MVILEEKSGKGIAAESVEVPQSGLYQKEAIGGVFFNLKADVRRRIF